MLFNSQDLIDLFNGLFKDTTQTILRGGGSEPVYLPKNSACAFHQIIFTQDFYASALHEIAHWCIAGQKRRQLMDYGYWYKPDGRDTHAQQLFEQVEVKPQALEWIFAETVGAPFNISRDNLSGYVSTEETLFQQKVSEQKIYYLQNGLPKRAAQFKAGLMAFYFSTLHQAI